MASHHPHIPLQHNCQSSVPVMATSTTSTCCCSCHYNRCCLQNHHPSSPTQHLSIDPLLQALASFLQQQQQVPHLYSPCPDKRHTQKGHPDNPHFHPQDLHFQQLRDEQRTQSVLSSLLERINSLESSLHRFSTFTSNNPCRPSYSLREAAARVIQTHFRAFLARRSRTLSQLQDLAFIKSSFNSLKSSISNRTRFNFEGISHKAMDLLLKLDSIQGGDPMIRDGKRSISRDIVRFLEFVDGLSAKKHECLYKTAKNVRLIRNSNKSRFLNASTVHGDLCGHPKETIGKLRGRVEKIRVSSDVSGDHEEDEEVEGFQQFINNEEDEGESPKLFPNGNQGVSRVRNGVLIKSNADRPRVKKTVSFAENGNEYRVISDNHGDGSCTEGSDSSDDHVETMDYNEIEENKAISKGTEDDEVVEYENAASTQRNPTRNASRCSDCDSHVFCQDEYGNLVFCAPVPVKMESRAD